MSELVRLSLSMERPLLERLEKMVRKSSSTNRSEFIRDMIRQRLVEQEWRRNEEVLGTITLLYNHHFRQLSGRLTDLQHDHCGSILSTIHLHLSKHICAEVIIVRGRAGQIKNIADSLRQQKGVLHAVLSMTSVGKKLK